MSEITDFHQLDTCDCGGVLDALTTYYTAKEREDSGLPGRHYRTEWICQKCGAVSDQLHDANMNDITSEQSLTP